MNHRAENWPADKIIRRNVLELVPYARNARTHSPEQIDQIAASIKKWGFTTPILLDENSGIIAGHGRVLAAKKLGILTLPCMVADGWSETDRRAYILADNKLALNAGWNDDLLKVELGELQALDFDWSLTGFSEAEWGALLADRNAGLTDPDDAQEPPAEPVSELGDVWVMGNHRLICGDSTDADVLARLTCGVVPDLANCDPPYGISVVKCASVGGAKPFGHVARSDVHSVEFKKTGKVGGGHPHTDAGDKGKPGHGHGQAPLGPALRGRVHGPAHRAIIKPGVYAPVIGDETIDTAVAAYAALIKLGVPAIVLWGGNYYAHELPPSRCWLVWDKENTGTFADAELAWTNQDKIVRLLRHRWSGLMKASERGERRVHPTQKPVALAEWVIDTIAPDAQTVIDQFGGSCSTLIACEIKKKRAFVGELSPAYVDCGVLRWQNFTGKTATLEESGQTFDEVKASRRPSSDSSSTPTSKDSRRKAG